MLKLLSKAWLSRRSRRIQSRFHLLALRILLRTADRDGELWKVPHLIRRHDSCCNCGRHHVERFGDRDGRKPLLHYDTAGSRLQWYGQRDGCFEQHHVDSDDGVEQHDLGCGSHHRSTHHACCWNWVANGAGFTTEHQRCADGPILWNARCDLLGGSCAVVMRGMRTGNVTLGNHLGRIGHQYFWHHGHLEQHRKRRSTQNKPNRRDSTYT